MSTSPFKEQDQFICDWFDNLDEDFIRQLHELHDDYDMTPRRAYHNVFGESDRVCTCKACLLPGQKDPGASLAAPAQVNQAEGTPDLKAVEKLLRELLFKEQNNLGVVAVLSVATTLAAFCAVMKFAKAHGISFAEAQTFIVDFLERRK